MVSARAGLAAVAFSLFTATNAHMRMDSPYPYGFSSLDSSPLLEDASNFPCKQRTGVYNIEKMNNIAVGVPQTLSFIGDAVHGGGSCQVSVTMDQKPTKNSQWKVVKSIISGCPANVAGNLGGDPNGKRASTFQFTLPKGMPNGQYSLAWTWNNKIGNREMYMNCAPIDVTGGVDGDLSVFNSLPDMFVVNLPPSQCKAAEGFDLVYPNPGKDVQTAGIGPFLTGVAGPGCATQTKMGAGTGTPAAPSPPSNQNPPKQSTTAAPVTTPRPGNGNPGGIFAPGASGTPTTSFATTTKAATKPTANPGANLPKDPEIPKPGNGACAAGSISCTNPGALVCSGSKQWGTCDINNCAVLRDVAEGTVCSAGVIAAAVKRSHRHWARHAFRMHKHIF